MSEARKKLIETVAATISGDLSDKLDILEKDIQRRQSVVSELDKHEADARKKLEELYAEITEAAQLLKQSEGEAESTKSTAHGHADRIRAEAKAEALSTASQAARDADKVVSDARKMRDALATDLLKKKQELQEVQAEVSAAKTQLDVMKQQARKFAEG